MVATQAQALRFKERRFATAVPRASTDREKLAFLLKLFQTAYDRKTTRGTVPLFRSSKNFLACGVRNCLIRIIGYQRIPRITAQFLPFILPHKAVFILIE